MWCIWVHPPRLEIAKTADVDDVARICPRVSAAPARGVDEEVPFCALRAFPFGVVGFLELLALHHPDDVPLAISVFSLPVGFLCLIRGVEGRWPDLGFAFALPAVLAFGRAFWAGFRFDCIKLASARMYHPVRPAVSRL